MLRRITRAFLDSQALTEFTQSGVVWSIGRFAPKSARQYFRDICHSLAHTPQQITISQARNRRWKYHAPLLSVIVPCYNYGKYIRDALQSIRAQTFRDYEVIVIDDGSTDKLTLKTLEKLRQEAKVRSQEHSGPARALNNGISMAKGKYVCCISADDTIEPTYFEKCLALLESNPGISFAYSLVKMFGRENRIGVTKPFDLRLLLTYNHVCGSAVFLRDAWRIVGGFDTSMSAYEDWDFWIRLGKLGFRGKLIPEPLFNWRRHHQTFGSKVDQRRPELLAQIKNNHPDLFSNYARIEKIRRNYRDYRISNPFINLDSAKEYAPLARPVYLILASEPPLTTKIPTFLSQLKKQVTLITITISTLKLNPETQSASSLTYNLAAFIEPYYWSDFVINLIRTRKIQLVIILNSKIGYACSPQIRKQTSSIIMDAIESEKFQEISKKFDSYLDYHITFSEENAQSMVNICSNAAEKIISPTALLKKDFTLLRTT